MNETKFPGQTDFYQGKVRDLYTIGSVIVAETTNRISAFDHILPFEVDRKGAVLNLIAAHFLKATADIIPNCLLDVPTQNTQIWRKTTPFKIEVIVRGYNTGSFYRQYYEERKSNPWGFELDLGIEKNGKFTNPLITPTTKATEGHDEDISSVDIIGKGLATEEEWKYISEKALKLFARGQTMADERSLILVDTKYEFGKDDDGTIYLIDEVHTPDSSRYWYKDGYEKALKNKKDPQALSKEFVRQFLMDKGFKGEKGQTMPRFEAAMINDISIRYIELYNILVGSANVGITIYTDIPSEKIIDSLIKIRPMIEGPQVSVVMGSKSDLPIMQKAIAILAKAGVPLEVGIISAHRTPERLASFAEMAAENGIKVIIAGAGGAAHLPGMVAANTILPVIGVPVKSSNSMIGLDSLLSIGQMPSGVPVATMAIDGSENAGLLALQILALNDARIREYLKEYKKELKSKVSVMQEETTKLYYFSPVV